MFKSVIRETGHRALNIDFSGREGDREDRGESRGAGPATVSLFGGLRYERG